VRTKIEMWLSREQKKEEICTWCEMALTQRETGVTQVERLLKAVVHNVVS